MSVISFTFLPDLFPVWCIYRRILAPQGDAGAAQHLGRYALLDGSRGSRLRTTSRPFVRYPMWCLVAGNYSSRVGSGRASAIAFTSDASIIPDSEVGSRRVFISVGLETQWGGLLARWWLTKAFRERYWICVIGFLQSNDYRWVIYDGECALWAAIYCV